MPLPEETCAVRASSDAARAEKAAAAAGVCYDKAITIEDRAEAASYHVNLETYCMQAYRASVDALRTALGAAEISLRGNTHSCSAAADAARACECASRASTLSAAAWAEWKRKWGG